MRSSIATYRESLSRIAGEVLDAADELDAAPREVSTQPSSGRRRRYSRPSSLSPSLAANGTDPSEHDEIAKYKADIQKLQSSEAEIKALTFNYATMLKEREEQLSKLREENGSLRKSLEAKVTVGNASGDEISKTLSSTTNGILERSPSRVQRHTIQENSLNASKQNGYSSGISHAAQLNGMHKTTSSAIYHKRDANVLEGNNISLSAVQASLENEIKQLKVQLSSEREKATEIMKKLEDESKRNEHFQRQLSEVKNDKESILIDVEELRKELNQKMSELKRLQDELSRRDSECVSEGSVQSLKSMVIALQKENSELKIEKDKLEADLISIKCASQKSGGDDSDTKGVADLRKVTEEMASTISSLKKTLKDTSLERDKALQDLARLKQHLLDKELEDSEKMDEDSKLIDELRVNCEHQRAYILQLERALKLEMAKEEENKKTTSEELQKSKEMVDDLRQKLASCMSALESKNVELLNLQTALGQYYAESEAKERLGSDLAMAREELSKLSESLKVANQGIEISSRQKEEVVARLSQSERMLADGKRSMQKLEEDNSRLRRVLEQNMTTLNRMSLDSDNYVDRRIVIKLLVTYFQRNHSKEVLDLMVRMLGFSEEDKQRIGFAQHTAGKGVVRGVLGLPGRVVGGILGGHSAQASTQGTPDNQSFADLWVDFLLKETEEREKREFSEAARLSLSTQEKNHTPSTSNASSLQPSSNLSSSARSQPLGHSDTEFATIPLTSSTFSSKQNPFSQLPPR